MVNIRWTLVLGLIACWAGPLAAGTASGTMDVTATVADSCRLEARPVRFDAPPLFSGPIDAQSSLTLTCTPAAGYLVTIDHGRNGARGGRWMVDPASERSLAYQIHSDPARTRPWGADAASGVSGVVPPGGRIELAVYARIETEEPLAGTYADTMTITVAF
jgi:spore coat protein U-like protein